MESLNIHSTDDLQSLAQFHHAGNELTENMPILLERNARTNFIEATSRPFQFVGAMNEDVNTYTTLGSRGDLFLTIPFCSLDQTQTQSQAGGITDMYLKYGTYCKAFTTVMMHPSGVKITLMRTSRAAHTSFNDLVKDYTDDNFRKI